MWWRLAERGASWLVDAGFNLATRPRKSMEEREEELDQAIVVLEKEETPPPPPPPARPRRPQTRP